MLINLRCQTIKKDMEKPTLVIPGIPGFEGADPEWVGKTLNEVHDLAQGLAYGRKGSLVGLDRNNAYYIGRALQAGETLALERLFEIMLEIRRNRSHADISTDSNQ